jgi:hypothetical protein
VLYPFLAQQQAEYTTWVSLLCIANCTIPSCIAIATSAVLLVLTSFALVTACLTIASLAWRQFTARESTLACSLATRLLVITCFNYSKEGHKSLACLEPRKPSAIHEIDE